MKILKIMKIGALAKFLVIAMVLFSVALALLIASRINELNALESKATFKQLGLELSGASDFLTEQAQKYVQYGERKYFDAYWDEIDNKKNRERVVSELKNLGAPQNELAFVEKAAQLSNTLAELEDKAFAAVERGDLETARSLIFGAEYDKGKIPIIETMNEFQAAMDTRTTKAARTAELLANICTVILFIMFEVIAVILIISLRAVNMSFGNTVRKLQEITPEVDSASLKLSESSNNLAQGSSEQASSIEETSATMNESEAMITQTTENIRIANQITSDTVNVANEAGQCMLEMMNTIDKLVNASATASKIIKTINDIASKTNLLAINATVEAARAGGEAGRSFEVVAQEVRRLAQNSAEAAKNTAEIIEEEVKLINSVQKDAERVSVQAKKNAEQIGGLKNLIQEINTASEEQASGIKQITIAVNQMEKATQVNAAIAEQSSASANELSNLSNTLSDITEQLSVMI